MAAVVIAVGTLVFAPRGSHAAPAKEFSWQGPIAAGKTLDVRGLNGGIVAVAAPGRQATVRATKTARRGDPDRVRIETWSENGNVHFCSIEPGQVAVGDDPCDVKDVRKRRGASHDDDEGVEVAWRLEVPSGVRLVTRTVNGDVDIRDLGGPVEVATVNGSIDLGTRDVAEATTVNGSIDARLGTGRLPHDLEFRTVNGSVTVTMPEGAGAEVLAESLNGEFDSDFPVTVASRIRGHRLRGTIGGGGARLSLATVNGSLALRRQSARSK